MYSRMIENQLHVLIKRQHEINNCMVLIPLYCGPVASEGCNDYHPMFFIHDRAWEEFFCVCIQLLNKTWKEMRATAEDFNKVRGHPGRHTSIHLTCFD